MNGILERRHASLPVACLLAGILSLSWTSNADATEAWRPSPAQLQRLAELEPYIRYFTSVTYEGTAASISSAYIRALILTESGGDSAARSRFGARGVTQILPSTARKVLELLASMDRDFHYIDESVFQSFKPDDLHDPALNILIACYLTATYHAMYEGRTDLVISAWNAGPGAVARYGNSPPPFPETRHLIRRVETTIDYLDKIEVN
jgi:soluble lytic murein transglycosylase-like protein